jgi:hypothetical protein
LGSVGHLALGIQPIYLERVALSVNPSSRHTSDRLSA